MYFLSFVGPDYSRSSTLLNFKSSVIEKRFLQFSPGVIGIIRTILKNKNELSRANAIVVMSPCHLIAPLAKIFLKKKIILDAGWPLSDGNLSRGAHKRRPFHFLVVFLLDFISFHVSDKIFLESQLQVIRCKKLFMLQENKLVVQYTGLNESQFGTFKPKSQLINQLEFEIKTANKPLVVMFRGKVNSESGFGTILETAWLMSDVALFIFVVGPGQTDVTLPKNAVIFSDITNADMEHLYDLADVSLGQISNHKRLSYTIPHKAFEAAYFSQCYVTADSKGIRELFEENSVFYLSEISISKLLESLTTLMDKKARGRYSAEISKVYSKKISQTKINEVFDSTVMEILFSARTLR